MNKKKTIFKIKSYRIFVGLVLAFCLLGSIFGISYAYLSGVFKKDFNGENPFLQLDYYYNGTKINIDSNSDGVVDVGYGITGTISTDGVVNISVNGQAISNNTSSNATINLPIYLKNSGNIDGEVYSIMALFEFFDNTGAEVDVTQSSGEGVFYLELKSVNGFVIENNNDFQTESVITLLSGSENQQQILSSIQVADSNIIKTTALAGKNFKLTFIVDIYQVGAEEIE